MVSEIILDIGSALHLSTGVFIRKGEDTETHRGDDAIKMEVEVGVIHL